MTGSRFHAIVAGTRIADDWFDGMIPENIEAGTGSVIDSSFCFQRYHATGPCGLRVGRDTTIWRTSLAVETGAIIEIGDSCYLADAALACLERISMGNDVLIAAGVTIVDSDFHPFDVGGRMADAEAISPLGQWENRPAVDARPVEIEDGVRIGYNATILKGVHIGAGAVIGPGAVVSRDVAPGVYVSGNPAREAGQDEPS
jgi:acetyltransferase-like isoleucine patch superfamily enzyme